MIFYCGITDRRWNYHPVAPGAYACISPVYGKTARTKAESRVTVPEGVKVIQDSGAFSDSWEQRLSFRGAWVRQIMHARKWDYERKLEYRASYDLLIDEVWHEGNRTKRRWDESKANEAVSITVAAAQFLYEHEADVPRIQSAQGVTARQYLDCVKRLMPFIDCDRDALGLGGWCVIGKYPTQMPPIFYETLSLVIPFAAKEGVKRVHIWGVCYPMAIAPLQYICDQYGIAVSTDSTSPQQYPVNGQWGYGDWRDNSYQQPPVATRGLERARHVKATVEWMQRLETTQYYLNPAVLTQCEKPTAHKKRKPMQMRLGI